MDKKKKNPNEPVLDKIRLMGKPIRAISKHKLDINLGKNNPLLKWIEANKK
jgi:hypothetical protein